MTSDELITAWEIQTNPHCIQRVDDFAEAITLQTQVVIHRLEHDLTGSNELSALIKCVISRLLFRRVEVEVDGTLGKWIVLCDWRDSRLCDRHTMLVPYTTSMDAIIPGEDIVMLVKQHRVPGTEIDRWTAKQDGAKIAYLANDRILACRLNGLWALMSGRTVPRVPGSLKGQISIGPEFFEPLPPRGEGATENC